MPHAELSIPLKINLKTTERGFGVVDVAEVSQGSRLLIATRMGMCIVINRRDVRTTGRNTVGVKAINLNDGDTVVSILSI